MPQKSDTAAFVLALDPVSPPPGLERCVVAIGNFDGVHRGHKAVIARAMGLARQLARPCAVLTFEPHPSDFFAREQVIFRLTPSAASGAAPPEVGAAGPETRALLGRVDGIPDMHF